MMPISTIRILVALGLAVLQQSSIDHPLTKRFDAAVRAVMPQARPEALSVGQESRDEFRQWVDGENRVTALYSVEASDEKAKERFRWATETLQVGGIRVDGIGDEAFLVVLPSPTTGNRRLNFRRGRVVVQLSAPGPWDENVKRVAALFVDQVNRSIRERELENIER